MDITIGVGGTTLSNDDFITFPINSGENGLNAEMTRPSTTSNAIASSGSKTFGFTTANNLGWYIGTRLRFSHDINNYMEGTVTGVGLNGVTATMDNSLGSGTYNTWNIAIAGDKGINGIGIASIVLISTVGLVKTYRITYTNTTTFDYTVTDGANGLPANMTRTSSTSNIIESSGSKTFTYTSSSNLGWLIGTRLRFFHSTGNYMEGVITAVSATSVTATIDKAVGSGTYVSWNIAITGDNGVDSTSNNFQKSITVTTNYNVVEADNNYSIIVNNGSNDVTITVPAGLSSNFICAFTQMGSGDVAFVESSTTINTPIGLLIKGQFYAVALEQIGATDEYNLLGNSKT